jgi:hypothetical protein
VTANEALERLPALPAALGSSDSVSGKVDGVPEIRDKASCSNCPVWHASGLQEGQLRDADSFLGPFGSFRSCRRCTGKLQDHHGVPPIGARAFPEV